MVPFLSLHEFPMMGLFCDDMYIDYQKRERTGYLQQHVTHTHTTLYCPNYQIPQANMLCTYILHHHNIMALSYKYKTQILTLTWMSVIYVCNVSLP